MCKRENYLVLCYAISFGGCGQLGAVHAREGKDEERKGVAMAFCLLNGYPLLAFCKKAVWERSR